MKITCILVFLVLSTSYLYSQKPVKADTVKPRKGNVDKQIEKIKDNKIKQHSDVPGGTQPKKSDAIDSTKRNRYGDLLYDDPEYNKVYPIWKPALEIFGTNTLLLSTDRYILKYSYSKEVSLNSWNHNIHTGWEWDEDRFGVNFILHPYTGNLYFNAARSNGYNYFQSYVFAAGGSLMWEYFGENTLPSYNDIINTSINGAFLGEILYRISSNILDDRTSGSNRMWREILAGVIDPMRGFNRLLEGKCSRTTNKEVYAKEPLNITVFAGVHKINDNSKDVFGSGPVAKMLNFQIDYGNPFEVRTRNPFDFFKVRTEFDFGIGRKILNNVTGYGILFGRNFQLGKMAMLIGGFQYYDYWDNKTFELGAIAFGAGIFSKLPLSKTSNLYTNFHLAIIPFAGNSRVAGPDTSQVRDYNFGDGLEGKLESSINLGKYFTASLIYYYYLIHTYVGKPGNNLIGIFKPRITVNVYKNLSIGFEHQVYYDDRYLRDYPYVHLDRTEQKIFVLFYFQDAQRKGHYD